MSFETKTVGRLPEVEVPAKEVPKEYMDRIDAGDLGAAVIVFLNGSNLEELEAKKKDLMAFVKRMKKKYAKRSRL